MNPVVQHFLLVCGCALVLAATPARAAVKLPAVLSDHLVLQRDQVVPIWGVAEPGEKITVKFRRQEKTATADAKGRWLVKLDPLTAGGPDKLVVSGATSVELEDVLVGEVWICGGQSNMQFGLKGATNGEQHRAAATDPLIRLFTVPRFGPTQPNLKTDNHWWACDSNTVAYFSAVGYFFGRDLRRATKVPVGLISANVGGSTAESWMSWPTFESNPRLHSFVGSRAAAISNYPAALAKYRENEPALLAGWQAQAEHAKTDGKPAPPRPQPPRDPTTTGPSSLYNPMIAPLLPYAIRGVIWYQGESNANNPAQYQTLFPALIDGWRNAWGQGAFPFLFVQIAPGFGPEIRQAQLVSWQKTTNTAMIVIADHYEPTIHPALKEPIGARLALAARALAYGEKIEYSGPVYEAMKVDGGRIVLSFRHVGTGLVAKNGDLKGFTIAGTDGKFVNAEAQIEGATVVVSSPAVSQPVAVRYGWAKMPDTSLYNQEGLPATPFSTDWPSN